MAKVLGHSLTKTQTQAALVSAAAGIALLAIAIAGMRKGAPASASGDELNVAYKQGYNAGATDAETTTTARPDYLPGSWSDTPSASPSAPAAAAAAASSSTYSAPVATTTTKSSAVIPAGPITWAPWVTAGGPPPGGNQATATTPRTTAVIPAGPITWAPWVTAGAPAPSSAPSAPEPAANPYGIDYAQRAGERNTAPAEPVYAYGPTSTGRLQ